MAGWRRRAMAAVLAVALPGGALAGAVPRDTALSALAELYASYYVNERCNFVVAADEAFVADVEHYLITEAALARPDLDAVYLEARRVASVGPCDAAQRRRVLSAYDLYRKRYGDAGRPR